MNNLKIKKLSFIIPAMNEEATIKTLYQGIKSNVQKLKLQHEVIFIDDGSTDNTWLEICLLAEAETNVKAIKFRTNSGKARALTAGFKHATGDLVFTMDADLQDDPNEISRFIEKIAEGNDIVTGYKLKRHDPWHKVLPSRVFNFLLSKLVAVKLHDHNCGFKCYKQEVIKNRKLYGDMHRMIPSLASIDGYQTAEIVVKHHPRQFGVSKYGVKRIYRGFMDMQTVYFLKYFRERPLHFMGALAAALSTIGAVLILAAISYHDGIYVNLASMSFMTAITLMALGFLSELKIANTFNDYNQLPISEAVNLVRKKYDLNQEKEQKIDRGNDILIVDDDPTLRKLLSYYLKKAGYQVIEATNGQEAIDKCTDNVGLVFMDIMMPEMDGIESLKVLQEQNHNLKIAMLSASGQITKAVEALKYGAFDYISKPFEPEDLIKAANTALSEVRSNNSEQVLH